MFNEIALDVFLSTYALSISIDLGRSLLEISLNFVTKNRKLVCLKEDECAFVVPCHNSEDVISETISSLPSNYKIYCVANACRDRTEELILANEKSTLISTKDPGKIKAVLLGALAAKKDGYSHFILLDDDVLWPKDPEGRHRELSVFDKTVSCTALPVLPDLSKKSPWVIRSQYLEYAMMIISKRSQAFLGNVIMASGAAGVFRVDHFLEAMKKHDGEHVGDDLQTSFIFHTLGYAIDFNPYLMIKTDVPGTFSIWWKQRTRRWEPSPVFNLIWHLKVMFLVPGLGPGWWIRGIALYRLLVVKLDVVRFLTLPFALIARPDLVFGVLAITYLSLVGKMFVFKKYFNENETSLFDVLTYPIYGALCWFSRVLSVPRGLQLLCRYWFFKKRRPLISECQHV